MALPSSPSWAEMATHQSLDQNHTGMWPWAKWLSIDEQSLKGLIAEGHLPTALPASGETSPLLMRDLGDTHSAHPEELQGGHGLA